ncbi:hypothetical protein SAMN04487820_102113 [Actinopolyspora mzabensis]|uniref:Uncharacterized protein n=2 Tax=Actinopolyspora mzabensis TaxID=995066 RepID=A0A1G8WM55_ACTMZ|nr:hypothetical protein SAMN04487820_102113 [Actinopolyspora mzabensis]
MKTRKITEIYARIKYDPLEIVNKDASEKSPDNAPEDLEDSLEENITDKQREEFYEAIQDMEEFLEQVWLVVHADIRCFEPGTAENRFLALINETQPNISDKETRLILEETLEIDTERYRTQVSIHTLERDHNQVLDGAMNSLSGGIWRSYTRPWGNDAKEETIIYWNPNEPEREDSIIEIAVRATHGPPRHLRKE